MTAAATMSLTEFLLARIAEDEDVMDEYGDVGMVDAGVWRHVPYEVWRELPEGRRLLAECEAKRRIVEMYRGTGVVDPDVDLDAHAITSAAHITARGALKILAAVYADHADYRDEWRP